MEIQLQQIDKIYEEEIHDIELDNGQNHDSSLVGSDKEMLSGDSDIDNNDDGVFLLKFMLVSYSLIKGSNSAPPLTFPDWGGWLAMPGARYGVEDVNVIVADLNQLLLPLGFYGRRCKLSFIVLNFMLLSDDVTMGIGMDFLG
ncbi:hypothetical protein L873DRAFT_1786101 [Choiromyces venosus 120613-1]|uniref:Uncharacterized protein n=1 Tax=Choiromyces venosus 120613-1 TaxID=1336337 RepID=A0A3N4K305_9PEZI|nr:hypothetical protein L873DRAFT_1786101 [Choiromyces venosus 120613-1]